jgi:hypothetical protein
MLVRLPSASDRSESVITTASSSPRRRTQRRGAPGHHSPRADYATLREERPRLRPSLANGTAGDNMITRRTSSTHKRKRKSIAISRGRRQWRDRLWR